MRTTLNLQDDLLKEARRVAVERRTTLTQIIEEALRRYLHPKKREKCDPVSPRWVVVSGERPPDVDIADRDRLYDFMENRPR